MTGDLFQHLRLKETMTLAELSERLDLKERTLLTLVRQYDIPLVHVDTTNLEQK